MEYETDAKNNSSGFCVLLAAIVVRYNFSPKSSIVEAPSFGKYEPKTLSKFKTRGGTRGDRRGILARIFKANHKTKRAARETGSAEGLAVTYHSSQRAKSPCTYKQRIKNKAKGLQQRFPHLWELDKHRLSSSTCSHWRGTGSEFALRLPCAW